MTPFPKVTTLIGDNDQHKDTSVEVVQTFKGESDKNTTSRKHGIIMTFGIKRSKNLKRKYGEYLAPNADNKCQREPRKSMTMTKIFMEKDKKGQQHSI